MHVRLLRGACGDRCANLCDQPKRIAHERQRLQPASASNGRSVKHSRNKPLHQGEVSRGQALGTGEQERIGSAQVDECQYRTNAARRTSRLVVPAAAALAQWRWRCTHVCADDQIEESFLPDEVGTRTCVRVGHTVHNPTVAKAETDGLVWPLGKRAMTGGTLWEAGRALHKQVFDRHSGVRL